MSTDGQPPCRGDVWLVQLDPTVGAEMRKTRPVIVISSDAVGRLPIRLVVPLTTWKDAFSHNIWHVRIEPDRANGLTATAAADALQTRGADTARLVTRLGRVADAVLDDICSAPMAAIEFEMGMPDAPPPSPALDARPVPRYPCRSNRPPRTAAMHFAPIAALLLALSLPAASYVPAPKPASTGRYLVGAMMCPLWREGCRGGNEWGCLERYPERTPLLGYYDEGSPEVTDWEAKWCLEHGISFMAVCWYRAKDNLGQPARPVLGHWLHDGLFKSRYGRHLKFAIIWENSNGIACGVQSETDLLENVLPYWIANYFRRPNYLRVDGKPVLFLYSASVLVRDLGGEEQARAAIVKMRERCKAAGLKGLVVVGENHERPGEPERALERLGFDCVFSYHWPTFSRRSPWPGTSQGIVDAQQQCWNEQAAASSLPSIPTVSMGWDSRPWGSPEAAAHWRLTPGEFEALCRRAKSELDRRKDSGNAGRMVLVDNWNEFGEGHYVAPTREFGFGYLDAIRRVFAPDAGPHRDLAPAEVGLGPYDGLYRAARGKVK